MHLGSRVSSGQAEPALPGSWKQTPPRGPPAAGVRRPCSVTSCAHVCLPQKETRLAGAAPKSRACRNVPCWGPGLCTGPARKREAEEHRGGGRVTTRRHWATWPQAKGRLDTWSPQKLGQAGRTLLRASRGSTALWHLDLSPVTLVSGFRPPEPQRINFCCFKSPNQ